MAAKKLKLNGARRVVVYDTTLRDGAQGSGVSFSVSDKLSISRALDRIGVDYVEGGFPGSNPKDEEFFAAMAGVPLKRARLAALGATRRTRFISGSAMYRLPSGPKAIPSGQTYAAVAGPPSPPPMQKPLPA